MCCFSGPVLHVSNTQIFARLSGGRQLTAYQLKLAAAHELAMVLPLPVVPGTREGGVRFVDLSQHRWLFSQLRAAFPDDDRDGAPGAGAELALERSAALLVVETVGAFDASFVPTPDDFARLDRRFRLAPELLEALPQYGDWGFVVFKLKPTSRAEDVHPMAFDFPSRAPREAFFPCLHVHDGQVHPEAEFDHQLYVQLGDDVPGPADGWRRSERLLGDAVIGDAAGLVDRDGRVWLRELHGMLPNLDHRVIAAPAGAEERVAVEQLRTNRRESEAAWAALQARERRSAVVRRVTRALISAPIAAGAAFFTYAAISGHRAGDSDGLPSAMVFAAVLLPALAALVEAVTGKVAAAGLAVLVAAACIAAGLLT